MFHCFSKGKKRRDKRRLREAYSSGQYHTPTGEQGASASEEGPHLRATLSIARSSDGGETYFDALDTMDSAPGSQRGNDDGAGEGLGLKVMKRLSLRRSSSGAKVKRGSNHLEANGTAEATGLARLPSAEAVIAPEPAAGASVGCLPLFSGSGVPHALSDKRFVRLTRPSAGSSVKYHKKGTSGTSTPVGGWCEADPTTFMVRSRDYMKTRQKTPCASSVYKLLNVDVYSFDFKIHHIARHIQLPDEPVVSVAAKELPPDEQLPPLLIINVQLPTYAPGFFGPHDGKGFSVVYYFALPTGWAPKDVNNPAALALVQRYFADGREADNSRTRDRLKLIPRVVNVDQWAVEGPLSGAEHKLLANYNDKPLMTKPQHRCFRGPNYFEIDIDVHSYAFIARRAFQSFIPRLWPVTWENAFVVQGNSPDELPEVLLGCARLYRINFMEERPFPAKLVQSPSGESVVAQD